MNPFSMPLQMVAFYAAINALVMLVLGILVVQARVKTRTEIGDGADPNLLGPLRAHGNNIEYVPLILIMLVVITIYLWFTNRGRQTRDVSVL